MPAGPRDFNHAAQKLRGAWACTCVCVCVRECVLEISTMLLNSRGACAQECVMYFLRAYTFR